MEWYMVLLVVALVVFWIWALVDMLQSRRIKKQTKMILVILFIVVNILTAIVWAIMRKKV